MRVDEGTMHRTTASEIGTRSLQVGWAKLEPGLDWNGLRYAA